ncbi:unnamed protein product [Rangifer tarandus platyrhynchus]|uniref:Uncharacterized protein n=2 Tax=Rangifer tarandus platyrhynchus TaxID=3082113 RepID=A0ABN8Z202_RANTA|nr:unnamed protein product [Rangifer tarandus platyrhynchus]CAI9703332.1 unnamed protein product [Rangifer tarandus platyrhynchus]
MVLLPGARERARGKASRRSAGPSHTFTRGLAAGASPGRRHRRQPSRCAPPARFPPRQPPSLPPPASPPRPGSQSRTATPEGRPRHCT